MIFSLKKFKAQYILILFWCIPFLSSAAQPVINVNGQSLLPKAEIFILPRTGDFLVGSTFEAPIYIDTGGQSINAINVKVYFNPSKLVIVNPSGGKSIFGIWVEPPTYDNAKGTASLVGIIPGGIVTSSGLIATMTFKVLAPGTADVSITDYSSANINDGLGSDVMLTRSGSRYSLALKPPEGVTIASDTHPLQDHWYNNNSPILRWDSLAGADGYSVLMDTNPATIPPTTATMQVSQTSYQNLKDGVWYFHVRSSVKGVWGSASHFQVKIDTAPPAAFTPDVNIIKDTSGVQKYLLSFLTTDSLSGIDHYEVGSIDQSAGAIQSPVFIQAESPYLAPNTSSHAIRVIIRAFDAASNIRESYIDLYSGLSLINTVKKYGYYLLIGIIILLLLELVLHYLFGHHILGNIRRAYALFKRISSNEKVEIVDVTAKGSNTQVPLPPYTESDAGNSIQNKQNNGEKPL